MTQTFPLYVGTLHLALAFRPYVFMFEIFEHSDFGFVSDFDLPAIARDAGT
jgi:hypothetical protein